MKLSLGEVVSVTKWHLQRASHPRHLPCRSMHAASPPTPLQKLKRIFTPRLNLWECVNCFSWCLFNICLSQLALGKYAPHHAAPAMPSGRNRLRSSVTFTLCMWACVRLCVCMCTCGNGMCVCSVCFVMVCASLCPCVCECACVWNCDAATEVTEWPPASPFTPSPDVESPYKLPLDET